MATAFEITGRDSLPTSAPAFAIAAVDKTLATNDWRALAAGAVEDNAFFHPDFVLPAVEGLARRVEVAALRDAGGRLIAHRTVYAQPARAHCVGRPALEP